MAKVDDYKTYWLDVAAKAGIPEDKAKAIAEHLGDEAIAKAFKQNFKALPDYSYDLDQVRDRTKADTTAEATAKAKAFYDDWWKNTGEPAYLESVRVADDYRKYRELYGDLNNDGSNNGKPTPPSFSREDADKMIAERLAAHDAAYVGLTKGAMKIAVQHFKDYGEVLNPDELEKFANENKLGDLNSAYEAYVKPRAEEKAKEKHEAELAAAREEGAREALSRHKLPADSKPREYVNPFLSTTEVPKDTNPEAFSRDSFMEGWNSKQ